MSKELFETPKKKGMCHTCVIMQKRQSQWQAFHFPLSNTIFLSSWRVYCDSDLIGGESYLISCLQKSVNMHLPIFSALIISCSSFNKSRFFPIFYKFFYSFFFPQNSLENENLLSPSFSFLWSYRWHSERLFFKRNIHLSSFSISRHDIHASFSITSYRYLR